MLQDKHGKPRHIGGCTAAIEDVLYTTGVEVGSVHAARVHLCRRSFLVDRGRGHHGRYIWQWFAVGPCQPWPTMRPEFTRKALRRSKIRCSKPHNS